MISQIQGNIISKQPTFLVVDIQGIGYGVNISLHTYKTLPNTSNITLLTYLLVKENVMELYGFNNPLEKMVFLKLITVSGIGARMALRILSECSPQNLIKYILQEQLDTLLKFKGVGKKMAQVLVANLKEPLEKITHQDDRVSINKSENTKNSSFSNQLIDDTISALTSLGIKEYQAKETIQKLTHQKEYTKIEDLISDALHQR